MRDYVLPIAAVMLASCGQSGDQPSNHAAARTKPDKPRYCFFKEDGTKTWKAIRGKDGHVVVTGKAYREDGRYMATLGDAKVDGNKAEVWPGVTTNTTGHSTADGWWDVKAVIPGSAGVDTVNVRCGERTLATLRLAKTG